MELGGKSPQIVFPDADIERASMGSSIGVFQNQGEICTAGSRLFVHRTHLRLLRRRNSPRRCQGIRRSATRRRRTRQLGSIVSREQMEKVVSYIEIGKKEGAILLCGGTRPADPVALERVLRQPDDLRRRPQRDADRAGGDLRAGGFRTSMERVRHHDRRGKRHRLRARRGALDGESPPGHQDRQGAAGGDRLDQQLQQSLRRGAVRRVQEKRFRQGVRFETLQYYTQTKSVFVSTAEKPIGLY